jgi:hypothetical protein
MNFEGLPKGVADNLRLIDATIGLIPHHFHEARLNADPEIRETYSRIVVKDMLLLLNLDKDLGVEFWGRMTHISEIEAAFNAFRMGTEILLQDHVHDTAIEIYYRLKQRLDQFVPRLPRLETWLDQLSPQ